MSVQKIRFMLLYLSFPVLVPAIISLLAYIFHHNTIAMITFWFMLGTLVMTGWFVVLGAMLTIATAGTKK